MATEERKAPSAQQVADAFLKQYYFDVLEHRPHDAPKFYVETSVVSRPGPDGTMVSLHSIEAINEHFLSYDYKNTTFELLSVDSQNSSEDGTFIMVNGFLTGKDYLRRKFTQMFYLALENKTYNVLNDIFRYVDDEAFTRSITLPVLESVPASAKVKPADELKNTEMIHKVAANTSEENNDAEMKNVSAGAAPPLNNGNIKHSDGKAVITQKPTEPIAETVAPPVDGTTRSFASIVQSMAKNETPFHVKAAVQKHKNLGQPRAAEAAEAPKAPISVSKSEKKNDKKIIDEPGTSIFVANLPLNAIPSQLYELFEGFGSVKENGIQVRSSRAQQGNPVCFGFVAFESSTSVQSVLQAAKNTPFILADRKLRVKEKQVDYDGSKPPLRKTRSGNWSQNGSANGGDEFRRNRNRRNGGKTERRGDRNNGDNNQKNSRGSPQVEAA